MGGEKQIPLLQFQIRGVRLDLIFGELKNEKETETSAVLNGS